MCCRPTRCACFGSIAITAVILEGASFKTKGKKGKEKKKAGVCGRNLRPTIVPKENHLLGRQDSDKADGNCQRFVKTM
jgi:hypothetical protein